MSIDLSNFKLFEPSPKLSQYAINVTASGCVNLNEMLRQKLLTAVGLWMSEDGTQIVLDLRAKNPFKILKSGSINDAQEFTRELASKGVVLPARYDANLDEEDQMWMGTLIKPKKQRKPIPINKNKLNKPRTAGLKDMML